jgi:hypothetical protein
VIMNFYDGGGQPKKIPKFVEKCLRGSIRHIWGCLRRI